ncbi:hypothetical protein OBK16_11990 [Empedobacter falsenii]|uniref:hypothetical protein n=1 Tax=Empedobacter falsenii TaxID=343874 RepID=UPI00057054D3|nr:hypothetical protein [Empedobacter falsenii]
MLNEFFASIYETFHYSNEFSGDLYNENIYQLLGVVLLLSSILIPFFYYKIIDKVHLAKIFIWGIIVLIAVVFNFAFAYIYPSNLLVGLGMEYDSNDYLSLAIVNAILALILTIIFSLIFKNISTNTKKIPF